MCHELEGYVSNEMASTRGSDRRKRRTASKRSKQKKQAKEGSKRRKQKKQRKQRNKEAKKERRKEGTNMNKERSKRPEAVCGSGRKSVIFFFFSSFLLCFFFSLFPWFVFSFFRSVLKYVPFLFQREDEEDRALRGVRAVSGSRDSCIYPGYITNLQRRNCRERPLARGRGGGFVSVGMELGGVRAVCDRVYVDIS